MDTVYYGYSRSYGSAVPRFLGQNTHGASNSILADVASVFPLFLAPIVWVERTGVIDLKHYTWDASLEYTREFRVEFSSSGEKKMRRFVGLFKGCHLMRSGGASYSAHVTRSEVSSGGQNGVFLPKTL